jgi:hypothetical protein
MFVNLLRHSDILKKKPLTSVKHCSTVFDIMKQHTKTARRRPLLAVTIDPEIYAWLKKGAKNSRRTLSGFVEAALGEAFDKRHTENKKAVAP